MVFAFRFVAHAAAKVLDGESRARYVGQLCQEDDRMISELAICETDKEILKGHLRNTWPGERYGGHLETALHLSWADVSTAGHYALRQATNVVFSDNVAVRDIPDKLFSGLFDYRDMHNGSGLGLPARGTGHHDRINGDLGFRICLRLLNIISRCNLHWKPDQGPMPSPDSPNPDITEKVIEALMVPLPTSPSSEKDSFHRGITLPFRDQHSIRRFVSSRALEVFLVGTAKGYVERYPALSWNFISALIQVFDAATLNSEASWRQSSSGLGQLFDAAKWSIGELRQDMSRPESAKERFLSPVSMTPSQATSPQSAPPSRKGVIARLLAKCERCQKSFQGRYATGNLNRHVKWTHERGRQNENDRRCQHCGKLFERPDNALKHSRQSCKMRPEALEYLGAVELGT